MVARILVGHAGRGAHAPEELALVASYLNSCVIMRSIALWLSDPFGCSTSEPVVLIPYEAISSVSKVGWGMPPEPWRIVWLMLD